MGSNPNEMDENNDLTSRPNPGIMVNKGESSPNGRTIQVSENYNLPRIMINNGYNWECRNMLKLCLVRRNGNNMQITPYTKVVPG